MKRLVAVLVLLALAIVAAILFRDGGNDVHRPSRGREATTVPAEPPAPTTSTQESADGPVVRGQVVDTDQVPIEGASVLLLTPWSDGGEPVTTDEDGRFALPFEEEGLVQCFASADGCVPAAGPWIRTSSQSGADAGTLVLAREALSIAGRVEDESGTGVPEIEVRIEAEEISEDWARRIEAWLDVSIETDANGTFRFDGLAPGLYRISADVVVAGVDGTVTTEPVEAGRKDVRIVSTRPVGKESLELRLRVELPNGSPLPRGRVSLRSRSSIVWGEVRDGEAFVGLTGIPPFNVFVLEPADAGRRPLPYRPHVTEGLPAGKHDLRVRLEPGLRMSGHVHFRGAPLDSVSVQARPIVHVRYDFLEEPKSPDRPMFEAPLPHSVSFLATSGKDGRFVLDRLFDAPYALLAKRAGFRTVRRFVPARAGDEDIVIEMVPSVTQRLRVLSENGVTLQGGQFMLWEVTPAGPAWSSAQQFTIWESEPGDSLSLDFYDLKPGSTYRVRFQPRDGLAASSLEFVAGSEPVAMHVGAGRVLDGVVVRRSGRVVAGAEIRTLPRMPPGTDPNVIEHVALGQPKTSSDLAGRFRMTGLPDDTVRVLASAPGLVQDGGPVDLSPGRSSVELVMVSAREISGRIVPAQPPDLIVEIWRDTPDGPERFDWFTAGADGFFRINSLPPGMFRLVIWNPNHDDDDRFVVTEPIQAGRRGLQLALQPGGRITGIVRERTSGSPLHGVSVVLETKHWTRRETTNVFGEFTFRALPLGRYRIRPVLSPGLGEGVEAATGEAITLRIRHP